MYCTLLYCTVLFCTILFCFVLYCTVLYGIQYYTVLYSIQYYTLLYHCATTELYSTTTVLYCNVLYSTTLYCTCESVQYVWWHEELGVQAPLPCTPGKNLNKMNKLFWLFYNRFHLYSIPRIYRTKDGE